MGYDALILIFIPICAFDLLIYLIQERVSSRSQITVEDLGSKSGTWLNDERFKGESRVLSQDVNILRMGSFPSKFRQVIL